MEIQWDPGYFRAIYDRNLKLITVRNLKDLQIGISKQLLRFDADHCQELERPSKYCRVISMTKIRS